MRVCVHAAHGQACPWVYTRVCVHAMGKFIHEGPGMCGLSVCEAGPVTHAVTRGPRLGSMFCRHQLEILNPSQTCGPGP